jgi:hypothetical protein
MLINCDECIYRDTDECRARGLERMIGTTMYPTGCTKGKKDPDLAREKKEEDGWANI